MSNKIIYTLRLLVLCMGISLAGAVWAIDLDAAKAQGLVGERADGYLGAVQSSPSAEVRALIDDVNGKRKARYQEIAKSNNIALGDVEARAGQRAIEKTRSGSWIFRGSWEKKP